MKSDNAPRLLVHEHRQTDLAQLLVEVAKTPCAIRQLRGERMGSIPKLLAEHAEALSFPSDFGNNWNALDECMADLSWIEGDSLLIVVCNALSVLQAEEDDFVAYVELLNRATAELASQRPPLQGKAVRVLLDERHENIPLLVARLARIDVQIGAFTP